MTFHMKLLVELTGIYGFIVREMEKKCYIPSPSRGLGKVQQENSFFLVEVITPVPASNHHTELK